MKVLLIAINYPPEQTGIAPYAAGVAQGLAERGHRVRVITGVPHYPQWHNFTGFTGLVRDDRIDGIRVRRVRHVISPGTGIGRIAQEISFGLMAALQRWSRPDVVLLISPPLLAASIALARAKLARVPVGIWVQDLYSSGMREMHEGNRSGRLLAALESAVLRAADGVLVIHDRFKRAVTADLGVAPERVEVSRNWSHLDVAEPDVSVPELRRRLFGDAATVALHTGNMGAKQGLENVVEAAREADRRSANVVFGLVGDGAQRADLEARANGVQRLVFVPSLPDAEYRAILRAADVLVVNERPGLREMAVPSKLTSYFLQRKPVVAAVEDDSTTASEVRAAGAGPVVPPGAPAELLAAVEQVGADAASAELGASARQFAERNLSASAAISRVEGWLHSVRERSGGRD